MAVRELFLPLLQRNVIDIDFIADKVALPKTVVSFVMQDIRWPPVHGGMMAALKARLPTPNRVHAVDSNQATMVVYSVPLEDDPYYYAKKIEERLRGTSREVSASIIETIVGSELFWQASWPPTPHGVS
jgi:hypothetical protein